MFRRFGAIGVGGGPHRIRTVRCVDDRGHLLTGAIGLLCTIALMVWLDWLLFVVVMIAVAVAGVATASMLRTIRTSAIATQNALGAMSGPVGDGPVRHPANPAGVV